MSFERSNIRAMTGYTSGEQPDRPDIIKLNTNENPYPPGPRVEEALRAIDVRSLRRYPPPTAMQLRQSLSQLHGVSSDNLIVTNGGDELLRLVLATFVEPANAGTPGECIGVADPSYSLYDVLAEAHGCGLKKFPLQADWSLPPHFAAQLNAAGVKLCFVVNPHAPSGHLTTPAVIEKIAREYRGVLVLDEAYVDFVDPALKHDCVALIEKLDNVLILRTFSKGYSLAGLRMAYGIGSRTLIDPMQYKTKDSYNTDFIAQALARAAIEDQVYASDTWRRVREQRAWLVTELQRLGLQAPPSQSNFVLATVPAPHDAAAVYQALKDAGILVRYFKLPRLEDKLRITIGTPEENARLVDALTRILKG
ncbi:MAG: histidinol-phosphate transaminase [Pseudomonadota bacterium]|nr:histidinol-phosphate transaminase [Pseudomonadota bacterium]